MFKRIALLFCLIVLPAGAQTIAPSQIKPGSNGQTLQTAGGKTVWGSSSAGASFPGTPGVVWNTSSTASRNGTFGDITGLWTSCSAGWLKFDGSCSVPTVFNQLLKVDGASLTQRGIVNFINGSAGSVSCVDNPVTLATDCTFTGGSTSGVVWSIYSVAGSHIVGKAVQNTTAWPMFVGGSLYTTGSGVGVIQVAQGPTEFSMTMIDWKNQSTATVSSGSAGFSAVVRPGWWYVVQASGAVTNSIENWTEMTGVGSGGGGGGGGGIPYPSGSGIPIVASGAAWGTTVAAPSGDVVGTTDTQTLTNKSIAGSEVNSGVIPVAQIPVATGSTLGAVKPDGTSCTVSAGVLTCSGGGDYTPPTGTGFVHITTGSQDSAARAVDLSGADATGTLAAAREPAHTGDVTNSAGSLAMTVGKVDGVAYPASPASTNLVPVVTTAGGSPAVTYQQVPNAALVNPFATVNGTTCTLGSPCTIASGSNIFGLWGFGTSIIAAAGSTNPARIGIFSLLCGTTSAPCYNYGFSGATVPLVTDTVFLQYAPSYQNPSAALFEAGENDSTCGTACNTAMKSQYYAVDAWIAIPPAYRQLASTAGGSTGTWFTDATFAIYQPPLAASPGLPAASTTSGSTKTFTIPSSASPVVGFTFGVENGFTGTFTLSIDGTLRTDSCSGTTTFSSAPCTPVVSGGGPYTFYREEYAVTPGTSHTVVVTTTNSGEVVPVSVDWIPPASEPTRGVVFHQSVLANYASFSTFNPIATTVVNQLHTDGLLVFYVDQTQYASCSPGATAASCPGVNITTDISGTATPACAATALSGHPNDCGNLHGFQTIANTEASVGVNIGNINPVGSSVANTGQFTSPIQIGNIPSGSQHYSIFNQSTVGAGALWYSAGSVFGEGMGQDTSTGLPWSNGFVNRSFVSGAGYGSCDALYNGSGLDTQSNFTELRCTDTSGNTYQLGTENAAHHVDRSLISQPCVGTDATGQFISGTCSGGSGTVNDGAGTTTANQLAVTTTTAHTIAYTTAVPNGTTATTQSVGDNTTKLATDAFVNQLINCGSSGAFPYQSGLGYVCSAEYFHPVGGGTTLQTTSTATSSANFNSPLETKSASFWTGTSGSLDSWTLQNVLGTGSNPTSTLTFTHSGTSGVATVGFPAVTVTSVNGTTVPSSSTLAVHVANGTSALGTSAIASGACATAVTTTATGTATTDVVGWGFNGDPTAVTGYSPTTNGMLTIIAYPTSGNVNFKVCNNTAASVTPGAITLNWSVIR